MSDTDLLHAAFANAFPVRAGRASFEVAGVAVLKPGVYGVTVRLVVWDTNADGVESIRDIKEQQVYMPIATLDVTRVDAFLHALAHVLSRALAHPEVDLLMPHDLFVCTPLKLKKARTEADFIAALSVPSRLGRYLAVTP